MADQQKMFDLHDTLVEVLDEQIKAHKKAEPNEDIAKGLATLCREARELLKQEDIKAQIVPGSKSGNLQQTLDSIEKEAGNIIELPQFNDESG